MKFTMRMRYAVLAILVLLIVAAPVTAYVGKDTFSWLVAKKLTVQAGGAQFESSVQMDDDLYVTGDTTLSGATAIEGAFTTGGGGFGIGATGCTLGAAGTLQCDGAATLGSTLSVTGTSTLIGAAAANGGLTVGGGFGNGGCTVSTAGALSCNSNAIIGGTMLVTGTSTFQNIMTVNGNLDADSISTAGTSDLTTILNTGIQPITVNDNLAVTGVLTTTGTSTLSGTTAVGGGYGNSGCTFTDAGVISCNGAATFASTLALTGNATLAGQISFTAPTQITVTADSTIATANYTVIPLYAAGSVGTATITGCETAGKLTILRNIANQTITITDTSTIMLGGNAALGQYDTLTLLGDGTNCLQISKADN